MPRTSVLRASGATREKVAAEVRAELARARLSQQQLATIIGKEQTYVSRRLKGEVPFTVDEVVIIAGYLGIAPRQLLAGILDDEPVAS